MTDTARNFPEILIKPANISNDAPADEQHLCVNCGMCCDGTLFGYGKLKSEEDKANAIHLNISIEKDKEEFKMPCNKYKREQGCTVYQQKRPFVCGYFRCILLELFEQGKVTKSSALQTINTALRLKEEFLEEARLTGLYSKEQLDKLNGNLHIFVESKGTLPKNDKYLKMHFRLASLVIYLQKHFYKNRSK